MDFVFISEENIKVEEAMKEEYVLKEESTFDIELINSIFFSFVIYLTYQQF